MEEFYECDFQGATIRLRRFKTFGEAYELLADLESSKSTLDDLTEGIKKLRAMIQEGDIEDDQGKPLDERLERLYRSQQGIALRLLDKTVAIVAKQSEPPVPIDQAQEIFMSFRTDSIQDLADLLSGFISIHIPEKRLVKN